MSLLTFDNPVFRYYALAAALMIIKMMSQGWITVFRMIKVNGGYRYPEDARQSLINRVPNADQLRRTLAANAWKRHREHSAVSHRRLAVRHHGARRCSGAGNVHNLRAVAFRPFLCRADGAIPRTSCRALDRRLGDHLCHGGRCDLGAVASLMIDRFILPPSWVGTNEVRSQVAGLRRRKGGTGKTGHSCILRPYPHHRHCGRAVWIDAVVLRSITISW